MSATILRPDFAANRLARALSAPATVIRFTDPEAAYALYLRAVLLDEDHATLDEAEELYERAIGLDPELAIAIVNLGNIHHRRGDAHVARKLYLRAIEVDDTVPEAHYNLGWLHVDEGKHVQAVPYFLRAVTLDEKFADAAFNLASCLEKLGKRRLARGYWKKYLALEPHGEWANVARAHVSGQTLPGRASR